MSDSRPDAAAWSDVDKAAQPAAFAQYLDTIRSLGAIETYKARSVELMGLVPGGSALDVGCGTGDDTRRLLARVGPLGRVLGITDRTAWNHELVRSTNLYSPGFPYLCRPFYLHIIRIWDS